MKVSIPAIAVASALCWILISPRAAAAREQGTDPRARRHLRHIAGVRREPLLEPHYLARPIYYRPYPYSVPAPFVFGFVPWR